MLKSTIDVIIPHYNSSFKLARLLNSIPQEDWINILVVDDHSVAEEKQKLTKLLEGVPNASMYQVPEGKKGPGHARNKGVSEGNGDWLIFADCDDYFSIDAFEHLKKLLCQDVDLIFFPPDSRINGTAGQGGRHRQYQRLFSEFEKTGDSKVFFKFYAPWSKLISRDLVEKHSILFDDGVGGEDNNFSLKTAFYAEDILAHHKTIYYVTESEDSLTSHMSESVLVNHFNAMARYNDFLQEHGLKQLQAPMLGWVLKARRISLNMVFKWFIICLKHGYPVNPLYYLKS